MNVAAWWNGRHERLKITFLRSAGSSPAAATKKPYDRKSLPRILTGCGVFFFSLSLPPPSIHVPCVTWTERIGREIPRWRGRWVNNSHVIRSSLRLHPSGPDWIDAART